ncbi:hypothetical protein [Chromobacterium sp. IIBBL 290-4]|uniref:hypothetical protein n=1 Tax=Chromobacterium sp. IIBBL 290-4 TaxID=2953890 RepID=UPI0020B63E9A|nr:hypothetical protein [Chromobacterium sp. IIBBL 290-4]UTH74124.1 hypothetical protein NKT35_21690 [Chromobacterium sp. IIBBL 290-4]
MALDGDALEPPMAEMGGRVEEAARKQAEPHRPKRDYRKIILLVLIAWLSLAAAGLFLWQKFSGYPPLPLEAAAKPPVSIVLDKRAPAPQASMPAAAPALQAHPANAGASAKPVMASAPQSLAARQPAVVSQAARKPGADLERLEDRVAKLEQELHALSGRGHGRARPSKPQAAHDAGKVVGMSSTSVWVRKAGGEMIELRVGDRFRGSEVIQRIDQQAQLIETDRGSYKAGL